MRRVALAVLFAAAACKKPVAAARYCNQDVSGIWVNASDPHFAYRLEDKGETVSGKFFSRDPDGGDSTSQPGEAILIELRRGAETLDGVMKASGQSPSGRTCPIDFKLQVTSCEAATLQVVAETRVSVRDDCSRAREEDGGLARTTLVEYRWQRPDAGK
jgi:hypothetical protein